MRNDVHAHRVLVAVAEVLGGVVDVSGVMFDTELAGRGGEVRVASHGALHLRNCINPEKSSNAGQTNKTQATAHLVDEFGIGAVGDRVHGSAHVVEDGENAGGLRGMREANMRDEHCIPWHYR